jgi:hypothetical protein
MNPNGLANQNNGGLLETFIDDDTSGLAFN